jgi:ATP-binding protein involved in chromosome partitioning
MVERYYKRSHFDDVVDLVLHTPAMHIKKRAEDDIKKTIHDLVSEAKESKH